MFEIGKTPVEDRRERTLELASCSGERVSIGAAETERAALLITLGFKPFDAMHIACAELASADILLTTDDRMIRLAARLGAQIRIALSNPVSWLQEIDT